MNRDLQLLMAGRGVYQWEIAKELGMSEGTICRWFRQELSEDRRTKILAALEKIEQRRGL